MAAVGVGGPGYGYHPGVWSSPGVILVIELPVCEFDVGSDVLWMEVIKMQALQE